MPGTQPWVSFNRVQTVKALKGSSPTLKDAEKDGYLSEDVLAELRTKAELVVKQYVEILAGQPSEKNMARVLDKLEISLLLGSNTDTGTCGEAFKSLAKASERIESQKEKKFRKNPTARNFEALLRSKNPAMLMGGKTQQGPPAGWKAAKTTHKVIQGDTLSKLARRYYVNAAFWDVICLDNSEILEGKVQLQIDTTLRIP